MPPLSLIVVAASMLARTASPDHAPAARRWQEGNSLS
jgi:hypothetical protein